MEHPFLGSRILYLQRRQFSKTAIQASKLAHLWSVATGPSVMGDPIFETHQMYASHGQFPTFHLTTCLARRAGQM